MSENVAAQRKRILQEMREMEQEDLDFELRLLDDPHSGNFRRDIRSHPDTGFLVAEALRRRYTPDIDVEEILETAIYINDWVDGRSNVTMSDIARDSIDIFTEAGADGAMLKRLSDLQGSESLRVLPDVMQLQPPQTVKHYYEGFNTGWSGYNPSMLNALMIEWVGAAVIAGRYDQVKYYGGNHPGFDVVADDGTRFDVKSAWRHDSSRLGFSPPRSATFDTTKVDVICLVVRVTDSEVSDEVWRADGRLTAKVSIQPGAVYLIPVTDFNTVLVRGNARGRGLVTEADIAAWRVR